MTTKVKHHLISLSLVALAASALFSAYAWSGFPGGPGLTPGIPSPLMDGRTPIFIESGADPTITPGFDVPPGSILRFGTAYYVKRGPSGATSTTALPGAATDWELIAPARLATWDITKVRYYLLDYDGGDDRHRCFVDLTAGTTITPGTIACKTFEHLLQILPRFGNGRSVVVLAKPRAAGATYRNIANSADAAVDFGGSSGWTYFGFRGSDGLTNSAAERLTLGAIQGQAGPGAGGAWTVAAGATSSVFSVSAGTFTAEPALIGMRVRFDVATTTAALRGVSAFINANTGTAITVGSNLAAVPAIGDLFYVERPGLRVGTFRAPSGDMAVAAGASSPYQYAGFAVTGSALGSLALSQGGAGQGAFIEATASTTNLVWIDGFAQGLFTIGNTYIDETAANRVVGFGIRHAGGTSLTLGETKRLNVNQSAFLHTSAVPSFATVGNGTVGGGGSYFAVGLTAATYGDSGAAVTIGTTSATTRSTRVVAGTVRVSGRATISSVDVTNATAAAVTIGTSATDNVSRTGFFSINNVTGSTGNTGVGVDASGAVGATLFLGRLSANTVTGSSGDVKLAGSAIAAHTDFTLTNVVDVNGNNFIGSAGAIVGPAALVSNQSGGALAVGNVIRSNGTTGQVTCAQADTTAHAGGAPCVMVTAPASAALGYMVCAGAPYVLFDGAPTVGGAAYESTGTSCKATTTVPAVAATNRKLRVGVPYAASGSTAYTSWHTETLSVLADGNP